MSVVRNASGHRSKPFRISTTPLNYVRPPGNLALNPPCARPVATRRLTQCPDWDIVRPGHRFRSLLIPLIRTRLLGRDLWVVESDLSYLEVYSVGVSTRRIVSRSRSSCAAFVAATSQTMS